MREKLDFQAVGGLSDCWLTTDHSESFEGEKNLLMKTVLN